MRCRTVEWFTPRRAAAARTGLRAPPASTSYAQCAGRILRDAAIRPSRRRHSAADQRLAEGRSGPAGDQGGGSLRRRSRRRGAGPLAARPQSPEGWRTAPPLHACAPQGLTHAPQCRAMIGRGAILAVMALGVGAAALPQLDNGPPWLVWNAGASAPIGLRRPHDHRCSHRRPGRRQAARTPCPFPCRSRLSAARRAVAEACNGACRTNGLPHRPQRHCRRNRNGRGPRARQPGPRASCLGGLPRHRPGRSFPDEPAVRRSLDGRYFGPLRAASIVGRAIPLWVHQTEEEE